MESIHIIEDKSKSQTTTAIPEILSDALAISFDTHIGHDYIEDADERYEFYHRIEKRRCQESQGIHPRLDNKNKVNRKYF